MVHHRHRALLWPLANEQIRGERGAPLANLNQFSHNSRYLHRILVLATARILYVYR